MRRGSSFLVWQEPVLFPARQERGSPSHGRWTDAFLIWQGRYYKWRASFGEEEADDGDGFGVRAGGCGVAAAGLPFLDWPLGLLMPLVVFSFLEASFFGLACGGRVEWTERRT